MPQIFFAWTEAEIFIWDADYDLLICLTSVSRGSYSLVLS